MWGVFGGCFKENRGVFGVLPHGSKFDLNQSRSNFLPKNMIRLKSVLRFFLGASLTSCDCLCACCQVGEVEPEQNFLPQHRRGSANVIVWTCSACFMYPCPSATGRKAKKDSQRKRAQPEFPIFSHQIPSSLFSPAPDFEFRKIQAGCCPPHKQPTRIRKYW